MHKIDFKHFKAYLDITQTDREEVDIRRTFSDMIYKNINGIVAHDVALRIYHSDGPVEFNDEELDVIKSILYQTTPLFQDSLLANIVEEKQG